MWFSFASDLDYCPECDADLHEGGLLIDGRECRIDDEGEVLEAEEDANLILARPAPKGQCSSCGAELTKYLKSTREDEEQPAAP